MRRDRGNKPGGGILIYTSNQIKTIRREDLEYPSIESVWFEVIYKFQKPVVFGYVYRPPNSSIEWLSALESMIVKTEMEDKELVLLGDFNVDLFSKRIPSNWLHRQNIFNLSQLVKHPTRVTKSSATLIDHVYTNQPNHVKSVAVRNCSISDHYPVCISYHRKFGKTKKQHHEYITYRSMKNFDENLFLEDLEKSPFDNIHAFDDPDESLLFFMNTFSDVLNKHAPIRIKQVELSERNNLSG